MCSTFNQYNKTNIVISQFISNNNGKINVKKNDMKNKRLMIFLIFFSLTLSENKNELTNN